MGLVTSALTAGRNALLSYQGALQVVGNNVANAGNADYTRQSAQLSSVRGTRIGPGLEPGAGVALTGLRRHIDEALENRLRGATGDVQSALAQREALGRVEVFFNDTSGAGISSKLLAFFNSLSDVQNAPDDLAIRGVAISEASQLTSSIRSTRNSLLELGLTLNDEIRAAVIEADVLAERIAALNTEVVAIEATGSGQASALRDDRDALLRQLSEILDVQVREQPDSSVNVYVGSEPLIQHGSSRGLATVDELDGQFERTTVRFADTNSTVNVAGGRIEGLIAARDGDAFQRLEQLNVLAAGLITEINAIHADGQGLTPFRSLTASEVVADPDAALNSAEAGLRNQPTNGSFFVVVSDDATGTPTAHRIDIDLDGEGADTTLQDVVDAINNDVAGLTASITVDQRLHLEADAGFSVTFGHDGQSFRQDSSGVLAALGINTLFEGSSAADIAVRQEIIDDPALLAAATENRIGDGINAGRLAGVLNSASTALGGSSVLETYNQLANNVANAAASVADSVEAADAVAGALRAQRESVSGVSLDEESVDLLRFERAFQGAARYVTTVDRLMQELIALAG